MEQITQSEFSTINELVDFIKNHTTLKVSYAFLSCSPGTREPHYEIRVGANTFFVARVNSDMCVKFDDYIKMFYETNLQNIKE